MFRRILILSLVVIAALAAGWLALRRADIPYDSLEARYADGDSQFLTLENGLIVHYHDQGPRDAPVLVMVHGFSSSLHTWEYWTDALASDYRVVRFDLPGHGLTRVMDNTDLTTEGLADFVDVMAGQLKLDQFTLIGSSMGGHTAWTYATEHAESLEGLVLVAASGGQDVVSSKDTPLIFKLIQNPLIGPLLVDLDMTPLIRDGVEKSFVDQSLVDEDMIERYAELTRAPGHRNALLKLSTRPDDNLEASRRKLESLTVPTLVMVGLEDKIVTPGSSTKFADLIPGAQLVTYENVGHLPQEEIPQKSLQDLKVFLSGIAAPGPAASEASGPDAGGIPSAG